MFRIVCHPTSGSIELYLTEITLSGSQMFVVCLVGVWQCNFEPVVYVCVRTVRRAGNYCISRLIKVIIQRHRGVKYQYYVCTCDIFGLYTTIRTLRRC